MDSFWTVNSLQLPNSACCGAVGGFCVGYVEKAVAGVIMRANLKAQDAPSGDVGAYF